MKRHLFCLTQHCLHFTIINFYFSKTYHLLKDHMLEIIFISLDIVISSIIFISIVLLFWFVEHFILEK